MTLWIDAQLSPALASWITTTFPSTNAVAVRDIGLRDADDMEIFRKGKTAGSIILTKDEDFVRIVQHYGPPPQVIWLTCGNTSNAVLKENTRDPSGTSAKHPCSRRGVSRDKVTQTPSRASDGRC